MLYSICPSSDTSSQVPGGDDIAIAKPSADSQGSKSVGSKYAFATSQKYFVGSQSDITHDNEDQLKHNALITLQALDDISLGHIALHKNVRYQQDLRPLTDFVQLQLLDAFFFKRSLSNIKEWRGGKHCHSYN